MKITTLQRTGNWISVSVDNLPNEIHINLETYNSKEEIIARIKKAVNDILANEERATKSDELFAELSVGDTIA